AGDLFRGPRREAAAEGRGPGHELARGVVGAVEPVLEQVGERRRRAGLPGAAGARDLEREQRVALALGEDVAAADQGRDLLGAERAERAGGEALVAAEIAKHARRGAVVLELGRARAGRDEDAP